MTLQEKEQETKEVTDRVMDIQLKSDALMEIVKGFGPDWELVDLKLSLLVDLDHLAQAVRLLGELCRISKLPTNPIGPDSLRRRDDRNRHCLPIGS